MSHSFHKRQFKHELGKIIEKATSFGAYLQYMPLEWLGPLRIVVIVHGSLESDEQALDAAHRLVREWVDLANSEGLILVAPAFDQRNFENGPGGGYRGLFGRHVSADRYVNEIVDSYTPKYAWRLKSPGRFSLYGHSAGGQFISRYVVTHPNRCVSAAISGAGTFAFPNPTVKWADGMKELKRNIRWTDGLPDRQIVITPNPENWLWAATLPIGVVVGAEDTEQLTPIQGQRGDTRVARAQNWVKDMNQLATDNGEIGRCSFILVPNIAHNGFKLIPYCQDFLFPR